MYSDVSGCTCVLTDCSESSRSFDNSRCLSTDFSVKLRKSQTKKINMADETSDDRRAAFENLTHNNHSHYYDYDDLYPFEHPVIERFWIFFYSISIVCPIAIFCGAFTNILAFVVLVRSRLWLKHEGYVYLAANFCANVGILLFCTSSFWMTSVYGWGYYYPPHSSNFMCKVWHFFMSIFFASGWLSVALLLNVYLREHLTQRRRCGCPMFAAKYCTLFATKIIVGVIFGVLFVFGVPYLVLYELHELGGCALSRYGDVHMALLVETIAMWVLPFVFFLPIILLMTLCIKTQGNTFGFSQIEERSASDDQMKVMAVTLSSMTLFSQFVLVVFYSEVGRFMGTTGVVLVELVFGLSLALQPIICFVILKALRDGFRSQLRNIRCCRRMFPSLDRDEDVVRLTSIQEDPPSVAEPES